MKLIRRVHIQGLRSIRDQNLPEFGDFSILVGKNSSGKSNILRALNLFFHGTVENGRPPAFPRDHFEQPTRRQKKRISVSVEFEVPSGFHMRPELSAITALGNRFTVVRSWELDERRQLRDQMAIQTTTGEAVANGESIARQFLSLISYRYVPNRSVPAEVLREESQAIADSIFMRMKGDVHASKVIEALTAAAGRLLKDASTAMDAAGSPLTAPSVATAATLGEMLTMAGFQASGRHGAAVADEDWGAGHQAFFLYQLLHALDTNYGRFFGWRQAVVWGVEEPESGLHRDLETRLANQLRVWAKSSKSKLQIIGSTHSAIFTMAADTGYWVELTGAETTVDRRPISKLSRAAEVEGVSGWVHPVLSFPWNPVVLVEGYLDVEALAHVAALTGYEQLRILTLPNLDAGERGNGKDSITSYLKRNQGLVQNRPREAPLIVLLDWEVSPQELQTARNAYGAGGQNHVLRMESSHCHPRLGTDFKGIERFYPPSVVERAHTAGEIVIGVPLDSAHPYSVSAAQLSRAKSTLLKHLKDVNDLAQLQPLTRVLQDVDRAARNTMGLQLPLV